jgi:putative hydrolase of the HAD superfamily
MLTHLKTVRSLVFDLDGTLYNSIGMERGIVRAAQAAVSQARGVSGSAAEQMLRTARRALAETLEEDPTLTRTCTELGVDIRYLHRAFQQELKPEKFLSNDPILFALLDSLRGHGDLFIYTNNNLPMTQKILALLGVDELFERLYTIEMCWSPKPDLAAFTQVIENIGGPPESFLFVGDRQGIDLRLPREHGMATLLVHDTSELLQVHKLLGIIP